MPHDNLEQNLKGVPEHLQDKFKELMNEGNPMHDALSKTEETKKAESMRQILMVRMTVLEAYINDPNETRSALLKKYDETKDVTTVAEAQALLSQFQEELRTINESDVGQDVIKAHEVKLSHETNRE